MNYTAAIVAFVVSASASPAFAQPPPAPVQLFNLTLENETRLPLTQTTVTTPNVDLQQYGDGKNIVVATGAGPRLPRLFFGLCKGPCGFTLRARAGRMHCYGRAA